MGQTPRLSWPAWWNVSGPGHRNFLICSKIAKATLRRLWSIQAMILSKGMYLYCVRLWNNRKKEFRGSSPLKQHKTLLSKLPIKKSENEENLKKNWSKRKIIQKRARTSHFSIIVSYCIMLTKLKILKSSRSWLIGL